MTASSPLRFAVIGAGASIYRFMHRPAQAAEGIHVVAACDVNAAAGRAQAEEIDCAFYQDYRAMLAEVKPDVAVIVTPATRSRCRWTAQRMMHCWRTCRPDSHGEQAGMAGPSPA